jgi:hypothetical protein
MHWKIASIVCLISLCAGQPASSHRDARDARLDPSARLATEAPRSDEATTSTSVLANYTFDDPLGGWDPQGWYSRDRHANDFNYFHVDDFVAAGAPYAPLSGSHSLWCGRVGTCDTPGGTWPGYGNSWQHAFRSRAFAVTGDVVITYLAKWDLEDDFDYVHLQYLGSSGYWQTLLSYTSVGQETGYVVVPSANHGGVIHFRFLMDSDDIYSDEDNLWPSNGAIIIDDIIVADDTGTLDSEDFEGEAVGAQSTTDGDWWTANDLYGLYGNFGALFDGSTVLQEDSFVTNTTYLWGFFNQSGYDFSCAGHPEQKVVPYATTLPSGDWNDYIDNEIVSPWIDVLTDLYGSPLPTRPDTLVLSFDVYRHMPLNALVFYRYMYRFQYPDCLGEWHTDGQFYFWDAPDWYRFSADIEVPATATDVQLALRVQDYCIYWCGEFGDGTCHTHGPLFDNVRVALPGLITDAGETPVPGSYALHQNVPNPFNPVTTISYDVPPGGGDVTIEVFDVQGRLVATPVRGHRPEGAWSVTWDGHDARGRAVVSGIYLYRLTAPGVAETRKMVLLK